MKEEINRNQSLEEAVKDPNISVEDYLQLIKERDFLFDDKTDEYELD
jgi:hypothetical protein